MLRLTSFKDILPAVPIRCQEDAHSPPIQYTSTDQRASFDSDQGRGYTQISRPSLASRDTLEPHICISVGLCVTSLPQRAGYHVLYTTCICDLTTRYCGERLKAREAKAFLCRIVRARKTRNKIIVYPQTLYHTSYSNVTLARAVMKLAARVFGRGQLKHVVSVDKGSRVSG